MIDGYTKAGPDIQENLQDYFDCMNLNISIPTYLCQILGVYSRKLRREVRFTIHYMPSDSYAKFSNIKSVECRGRVVG